MALAALKRTLDIGDISLVLARVHGPVRDDIADMGIDADSDEPSIYPTVGEAVEAASRTHGGDS